MERILDADLVIDATGRRSRAGSWLAELHRELPPEEALRIEVAYASRRYRLPSDSLQDDLAIIDAPTLEHPRGGVLARVEGGHGLLTLAGVGEHPPTDPDGFLAFAESLPSPEIAEAVRRGEPVSDAVPFRFPCSTLAPLREASSPLGGSP